MLRRLPVSWSFAIAAMAPTLVALVFALEMTVRDRALVAEMRRLHADVVTAVTLADLAHQLQRERGLSAGYLAGAGTVFQDRLAEQRAATDAAVAVARADIARVGDADADIGAYSALADVAAALDDVVDRREDVTALAISAGDAVEAYTAINQRIFAFVSRIVRDTAEPSLGTRLVAFELLLRGKDVAGLGRAAGAQVFASDAPTVALLNQWRGISERETTYLQNAEAFLDAEAAALLRGYDRSDAAAAFRRLREAGLAGETGLDADAWWRSASQRVDALKRVEDVLTRGLLRQAVALRDAAEWHMVQTISLGVLGVLGAVLTAAALGLGVNRNFRRVVAATERLAGGDFSTPAELSGSNEFGRIGRALEAFRDSAASSSALAEAAQQEKAASSREARRLSEMSEWLQASRSLDELFDLVRGAMSRLLPQCRGALYIYSNSRDVLDGACAWNGGDLHPHLKPDDCWGLRRGRHYAFGAGSLDFPCSHYAESVRGAVQASRPHLCIPILAHGETVGLLTLETVDKLDVCDAHDRDIAQALFSEYRRLAQLCAEQISLAVANVKLRDQLHDRSIRDPLTGLFNRRHFAEVARRHYARTEQTGDPLALVAIDIDHFKKFNDAHGHDAGDMVLRAVAEVMADSCDGDEIACRTGGEELMLVLPHLDRDAAVSRAEALRAAVEALSVRYGEKTLPRVTISMGVAVAPGAHVTLQDAINAADTALYLAKDRGRNRVCVEGERTAGETPSLLAAS